MGIETNKLWFPATAITYTVLSGTIPTGLTLNSETGVLSGTPGIVGSDTTYNFAVRATDDYIGDEQQIADRTFSTIISGVAIPTFTTPTGTILNTNDSVWRELQIAYTNPVSTNYFTKLSFFSLRIFQFILSNLETIERKIY